MIQNFSKKNYYFCAIVIGLILSGFINISTSFAANRIAITVKNPDPYTGNQSWFVYKKSPGDLIEDIASVKNFGETPTIVKIYAVDATSNESGSYILRFSEETQKSIGVWAEIGKTDFTLQAGERMDIPFKINIPKDAPPGEYTGGIVVESSQLNENDFSDCRTNGVACAATSIKVKTRIGARVYLTIPGEIKEDVNLTGFWNINDVSGNYLKFKIENHGMVGYEPRAHVQILDGSGKIYEEFEKSLGDSAPNTTVEPVISLEKPLPAFGKFTARATVSFPQRFKYSDNTHGAAAEKTLSTTFWVAPWSAILIIIFLIISGTAGFLIYMGSHKRLLANADKCQIGENENIITIAEKHNISWHLLAKLNKIQPPYILKTGETLLIPKIQPKKKI